MISASGSDDCVLSFLKFIASLDMFSFCFNRHEQRKDISGLVRAAIPGI